jgi:hypothetical protein
MDVASYFFIFRTKVDKISIEEIDRKRAAEYSNLIIKNEYSGLYNHVRWHEYNRKALNMEVLISEEELDKKLADLAALFFNSTASFLLKVPLAMPHHQFLSEFKQNILDSLN